MPSSATFSSPVGQQSKTVRKSSPYGDPTPAQIRQRAYEIYVGRGATPGDPDWDWQQAELELRARIALLGRP